MQLAVNDEPKIRDFDTRLNVDVPSPANRGDESDAHKLFHPQEKISAIPRGAPLSAAETREPDYYHLQQQKTLLFFRMNA